MMQANARAKRCRSRLCVCGAMATLGLLMVGAREVTVELRQRPLQQQRVNACLREWSRAIVFDFPDGYRGEWQGVAEKHAGVILRSCARETAEAYHPHE